MAERIGKPQSFISKIETGERRLDLLEFYVLARAMGADPADLFADLVGKLPKNAPGSFLPLLESIRLRSFCSASERKTGAWGDEYLVIRGKWGRLRSVELPLNEIFWQGFKGVDSVRF